MKKNIVLVLFSCCVFLYGLEKIEIEHPRDSDIESIVVKKDFLVIKSKGKTYTFKLSELLNKKTALIPKHAPKNLEEAFTYNGEWYFFQIPKSNSNSLKYVKKLKYKAFYNGDLFEKVLYNGQYYARSLDKKIYEPHWETKKDFSSHLIPPKQYIESLDHNIELVKKAIKTLKLSIPKKQNTIKADREKYILFLKDNSLTIVTDKNGKVTTPQNYKKLPSAKLKRQLRIYYKNIINQEKQLKRSTIRLNNFEYKLRKQQAFKQKTENLYNQYVLNHNKEISK